MKANLPQNEPKRLEQWRLIDLYKLIREKSEGRPKSVLRSRSWEWSSSEST
jgi:isoleucyl-tRNA synthetase